MYLVDWLVWSLRALSASGCFFSRLASAFSQGTLRQGYMNDILYLTRLLAYYMRVLIGTSDMQSLIL